MIRRDASGAEGRSVDVFGIQVDDGRFINLGYLKTL